MTEWLVQEGQEFAREQPIYEVEGEKAVTQVEATTAGILARIIVPAGTLVDVGAALAVVLDPGEEAGAAEIDTFLENSRLTVVVGDVEDRSEVEPLASPDTQADRSQARAVPRARLLARQLGVDLYTIDPADGRTISVKDVELAAQGPPRVASAPAVRVRERRRLTSIEHAMARAAVRSWTQAPQFSQSAHLDASALLRRRHAATDQVSITDLLVHDVARAVLSVPEVNASFEGNELVFFETVNVSVAVATDRGLLLPVIRDANKLSPEAIGERLRDAVNRARSRGLRPEDSEGGTITVSNLGMAGVETGVPLLNAPQAAIVFAGTIAERPLAFEGAVVVRPTMFLTIAFDHRVVDGWTASRLTTALCALLTTDAG